MQTDRIRNEILDQIDRPDDALEQFLELSAIHLGLDPAAAGSPGSEES